eukprot:137733_1
MASSQLQFFRRIDKLIGEYYISFGMSDYFDPQNNGCFIRYIMDEELDDDDINIENELGHAAKPYDCIYVQFDSVNFPIASSLIDAQSDKETVIFYVLQHCYMFNTLPNTKYIETKLHNKLSQQIQDIILNILSSQSQGWVKDFKLVCKIVNNILSNPNNTKYQILDITALSDKLSDFPIWQKIFVIAGFYENNDGQFLFDEKNWEQLNILNKELTAIQNQQSLKLNDSHHVKSVAIDQFYSLKSDNNKQISVCICGQKLSAVHDSSSMYNGHGTVCDKCGNKSKSNYLFWHCLEIENVFHGFGYDVCNDCIVNMSCIDICPQKHFNDVDIKYEVCGHSVTECIHLNRFLQTINKHDINMDHELMKNVMNDYLHLLHCHNRDNDFEYIVAKMGLCDVTKCEMFRRHFRDPSGQPTNSTIFEEMLDKMHCYYVHSFDIGNRLKKEEQQTVASNDEYDIQSADNSLINKQLLKMNEMIFAKRQILNSLSGGGILVNRIKINNKFNQIIFEERKENAEINNKMYHFGFRYKYGYVGELNNYGNIQVSPKHSSLKEELLSNAISRLNIKQFNNEYQKAQIQYSSWYCKHIFYPRKGVFATDNFITWIFHLKYVFSLMIYCNYDVLQQQFSTTYRNDDEGSMHR